MTTIPAADARAGDGQLAVPIPPPWQRWLALGRRLAALDDIDAVLAQMVAAALDQIDRAEHASVTVIGTRGELASLTSDALAAEIDRCQHAAGQGPALSAPTDLCGVVRVDDLRTDPRWPRFATAVAHLDVRSMLAFHLCTTADGGTDTIGTITVAAATSAAFTENAVHAGLMLAGQAAVAVAAALRSGQLQTALASRDVIGQAKGILMERYKITAERAFDLLVAASQHGEGKLRDVAEMLATTGEIAIPAGARAAGHPPHGPHGSGTPAERASAR